MCHNLAVPFKVTEDNCFTQSDMMKVIFCYFIKVRLLDIKEYLLHSHIHRRPYTWNVRVK